MLQSNPQLTICQSNNAQLKGNIIIFLNLYSYPNTITLFQINNILRAFSMRGSSLTETHLLRVNIGFHSVNLTAKFSCDIVLTLKTHDNKVICQTVARPLVQGRCEINQQLQLQWQSAYDVGRSDYLQTSMEITVMVNSINGTIQAGLCVIDVTRVMNKANTPLKKCSDKSAFICITSSFEFLQVIQEKDPLESSKESYPSNSSINHNLKKMKSFQYLPKNQDSNLSISKITVSNKRLEGYLRGENEQLQRQSQISQGKLKLAERKQRELLQQLKQSINKYDKMNLKYLEQTSSLEFAQMSLEEKDRLIKSLQSDLKKYEFKVKQMSEQELNNEKKYEMKDQTSQEQIKKLNEKITNLQAQLQQSTQYQNTLLAKYESIEKNSQVVMKQRQKAMAQDKSKFLKEIIEKQSFIQSLLAQIKDLKENISQIQYNHKRQKQNMDLQRVIQQKRQQITSLNQQNIKIKQMYKQTQEELQQLRSQNSSRQTFRKKINQLQSENNSLKNQMQKTNQMLTFNELKLKEATDKLEQIEKQRKKYQNKYEEIILNNSSNSNKFIQLQKQIDYYRDSYQKLAQLLSETKEKKDQIQNRLKDQLQEWSKQVQFLAAQRSRFQTQNIDLKWDLQRCELSIKENQSIITAFKGEIFQLKQQLLLKSQRYGQFESKRQELEQNMNRLSSDLEVCENRVKQLLKLNTQKTTLNLAANKQKEKLLQQINQINKEHQEIVAQMKAQVNQNYLQYQTVQKQLQMARFQLKKKQQQFGSKQTQIQQKNSQIQKVKKSIQGILEQNQILSEENLRFSCDLTHKTSQIKVFKQSEQLLYKQVDRLKAELESLRKQHNENIGMFKHYKQTNGDAARWVLCILGQQELIIEKQTIFFPQQNLRQLQVQAIKNRNLFLSKLKKSMKAITQEKQFLTFELEKIGQQLIESSNDYQQLFERERKQKQASYRQFLGQRRMLVAQIQSQRQILQELKASNDNYFKQNRMLQHQLNQLEEEKAIIIREKQQLEQKNQQIQQQTTQKSQKLIYSQKQIQQKDLMLAQERKIFTFEQQKEKKRYQQQISVLGSKLKLRQQQMLSKTEKVKLLQEKCITLESQKRKIQFALSVLQHQSIQNQKKEEQLLRQKGQIILNIQLLDSQLQKKEKTVLQRQIKIVEITNQKYQIQQKYIEQQANNQRLNLRIICLETEITTKNDECKQLRTKSKQIEQAFGKNKQALQRQVHKLSGQIDIYKMLNEKLNLQLKEQSTQIKSLQEDLQAKKQHIIRLQSDHQMVQKEVFFEQSHKNSLERQFQELSQNYDHAKSDIYHLEQQKLKLEREIDQLNELIKQKQKAIQMEIQKSRIRVARQAADLKKRLQTQESKVAKLEANCQDLKHHIKQSESICQKKQFLLLASEQEKEKLRCDFEEEIERLNTQIQKLHQRSQETLGDYREQRQQLIRQIEHLNHQCMKKEEELEDNHRQHDSSLRKIAVLESEMKHLQREKSPKKEEDCQHDSIKLILDEIQGKSQPNKINMLSSNQYLQQ